MIKVTVQVDTSGIQRLGKKIDRGLKSPGTVPEIDGFFKRVGVRYRTFLQRRFNTFSRGGGEWPPLKPATIKRRRRQSSNILQDSRTLYLALNPAFVNKLGQYELRERNAVILGYGGHGRHPAAKQLTVAELTEIHHTGAGRVPIRRIVVKPDTRTLRGIQSDAEDALNKLIREANQ